MVIVMADVSVFVKVDVEDKVSSMQDVRFPIEVPMGDEPEAPGELSV